MNYDGPLYAEFAGKYVKMPNDAQDVDKLLEMLEHVEFTNGVCPYCEFPENLGHGKYCDLEEVLIKFGVRERKPTKHINVKGEIVE